MLGDRRHRWVLRVTEQAAILKSRRRLSERPVEAEGLGRKKKHGFSSGGWKKNEEKPRDTYSRDKHSLTTGLCEWSLDVTPRRTTETQRSKEGKRANHRETDFERIRPAELGKKKGIKKKAK